MHLYSTDKVFNDLKRTKYPVLEPNNETIYSWVVEHMNFDEHNIYIFMNTLYGLFLVFRYDTDKTLSINKPKFLNLLKQAHRDIGVDSALLKKYLPKKIDFTKSNNPDKDHVFVINDFISKQTDFIIKASFDPNSCYQRWFSRTLNQRFRDRWAIGELKDVTVDDYIEYGLIRLMEQEDCR